MEDSSAVDNSPLFKEGESNILKENLIDVLEYVLFPAEAWQSLISWYGVEEGQEPIARKVIEHGMFVKHCKVEIYLKLCLYSTMCSFVIQSFSRADCIEFVKTAIFCSVNICTVGCFPVGYEFQNAEMS